MASAYDEIKKVLAKLRQGEPITEQNRAELNRVREMLEQQLATAESPRNDLPPVMLEPRKAVAKISLAARKSSEP
jgi:DNA-binding transcriptional MerR regulator